MMDWSIKLGRNTAWKKLTRFWEDGLFYRQFLRSFSPSFSPEYFFLIMFCRKYANAPDVLMKGMEDKPDLVKAYCLEGLSVIAPDLLHSISPQFLEGSYNNETLRNEGLTPLRDKFEKVLKYSDKERQKQRVIISINHLKKAVEDNCLFTCYLFSGFGMDLFLNESDMDVLQYTKSKGSRKLHAYLKKAIDVKKVTLPQSFF